ncbi:hypothetical protein ACFYP4_02815 [Streptomyces sp. NPDC005551]|uniref:hypothetical protein n=1 Tax=Streptomyces sp. NPDC005551 TaxID=3364725 RepID=UPI00368474C8
MTTATKFPLSRLRRDQRHWRLFAAVIVVSLMSTGTYLGVYAASSRQVDFTVNSKERICSSDSSGTTDCKYLIFTSAGVFENTDSFMALKNNSSDLYNQLRAGERYEANVIGWRIPILSEYPNITSVTKEG